MLSESPEGVWVEEKPEVFGKFARQTALTLACLGSRRNAGQGANSAEFHEDRARHRGFREAPCCPMLRHMGTSQVTSALVLGGTASLFFVLTGRASAQSAPPSATASFPTLPAD